MKTILHLISSAGFYGAESMLVALASEQRRAGLHPIIGVLKNSRNPHLEVAERAQQRGLNVKILECRGLVDSKTLKDLRSLAVSHSVSLIHSHGYKTNIFSHLALHTLGVPRVTTCHLWKETSLRLRLYNHLDRLLLQRFDRVVCVSPKLREQAVDSGVPIEKVSVIYNGIDLEEFDSLPTSGGRESLHLHPEDIVVGTVAALSPEKGHRYLIEAAASLCRDIPSIRLVFVGDGPLANKLKSMVRDAGLENKVIFTGIRRDIVALLHCFDIFVLPSLHEGLPMALLEAMSASRAVIATEVGAIPQVIANWIDGLLVPSKTSAAFVEALGKLAVDSRLRQSLGARAREKIGREFSARRMAEEYNWVYREALRDKHEELAAKFRKSP